MLLKTDDFAGVQPILPAHKLGENQAQQALYCKFINGNLQPWREFSFTQNVPAGTKSIFRYSPTKWITSLHDADIVRSPILNDTEDRIYKTSSNTYPEMSFNTQIAVNNWFRLGVPAPTTAPTVGSNYSLPSGTITKVMSTTEYNDNPNAVCNQTTKCATTGSGPLVVTSASHGLETGQQVTIDMPIGITTIDGHRFGITVLDDDHFSLNGSTPSEGFPFESSGSWSLYRNENDKESRGYAFTFVTGQGEEGPPSPIATIDVYSDETVNISGMEAPPSGDYAFFGAALKRIYRSVTSSGGTNLYYIGEIPITASTFTDNIDPADIGEIIPSENWDMPPEDMRGLVSMPNGILAGFSGRDICFSVPFFPHAWPVDYRLTVDSEIVALGVYGQSMVVVTKERPYIVTGTDPSGMTLEKLEINQSCVSKRGLVDMGYSVIYPSPDGLVEVRQGSVNLITKHIFSRDQWQAINPSTINAFFWEGKYMFFSDAIGYLLSPDMPTISEFDGGVPAGYIDLEEDVLYVLAGPTLYQMEGGTGHGPYTWKSKVFRLQQPVNFAAAQVFRETEGDVTFKLYADGELVHTEAVASSEPFRLPSGFMGINYEYELTGTAIVNAVYVATTMAELRAI